jgi:hypothetical protein
MNNGMAIAAILLPAAAMAQGHERTEFRFTLDVDYETAAPLFGAWAERQWAPDWKPDFIYPTPPEDREGAVFRVGSGTAHSSVWMLTLFDLPGGHVQYALLLNQSIFARIDIHMARNGARKTDVAVAYEWTALDPAANDRLKALMNAHANQGPQWKAEIEASVRKAPSGGR